MAYVSRITSREDEYGEDMFIIEMEDEVSHNVFHRAKIVVTAGGDPSFTIAVYDGDNLVIASEYSMYDFREDDKNDEAKLS